MPALVIALFLFALLLGEIVYEISTGKLLARGWKVYARRQDNPMLYWSSMTLKILITLFTAFIVGIIVLKELLRG